MIAFRFPSLSHFIRASLLVLALGEGFLGQVMMAQQTGASEIKVPYSMSWGDSIEKLRGMIAAVKAHEVSNTEKSPGKVVIEVEGLGIGNPMLKRSLFTFRDAALVEVELQYTDPAWDGDKAVDFFDRTRRRIDERYGAGTLLVNKVKETPAGDKIPKDATYTLIIYNWIQPIVSLELNFYTMEEKENACRIVSLRYRTP